MNEAVLEKPKTTKKKVNYKHPCKSVIRRLNRTEEKRCISKLSYGQAFMSGGEAYIKIRTEYGDRHKCNVAVKMSAPWNCEVFDYNTKVDPRDASFEISY